MKKSILFLMFVLFGTAFSQTSGVIWIKTFEPGSANLNDPSIDREPLATLDKIMQDDNIEVTFLGAADSMRWVLNGRPVHPKISEAWNDAKRLSRARALRERYGRGNVGITHESVAGVKVVWSFRDEPRFTSDIQDLNRELAALKNEVSSLKPEIGKDGQNGSNGQNGHNPDTGHEYTWNLQAGMWTWQSSSKGNLISPSLTLNIIIDNTAFVLQGGVTPWHISSPVGNQSESFVYAGIKHMRTNNVGVTAGVFRGWEFLTSSDRWSFKTTGLSAGVVLKKGIIELHPAVTYSNANTFDESYWRLGGTLGVSFNINEVFKAKKGVSSH